MGRHREDLLAMLRPVSTWMDALPSRPRHLLGIGDLESVEAAMPFGIDSFDSAYPTRLGRHGTMLVQSDDGSLHRDSIYRAEHRAEHDRAADPKCKCPSCQSYSAAYVHHLHKANEPAGMLLTTMHNVYAMTKRMERLRQLILANEL